MSRIPEIRERSVLFERFIPRIETCLVPLIAKRLNQKRLVHDGVMWNRSLLDDVVNANINEFGKDVQDQHYNADPAGSSRDESIFSHLNSLNDPSASLPTDSPKLLYEGGQAEVDQILRSMTQVFCGCGVPSCMGSSNCVRTALDRIRAWQVSKIREKLMEAKKKSAAGIQPPSSSVEREGTELSAQTSQPKRGAKREIADLWGQSDNAARASAEQPITRPFSESHSKVHHGFQQSTWQDEHQEQPHGGGKRPNLGLSNHRNPVVMNTDDDQQKWKQFNMFARMLRSEKDPDRFAHLCKRALEEGMSCADKSANRVEAYRKLGGELLPSLESLTLERISASNEPMLNSKASPNDTLLKTFASIQQAISVCKTRKDGLELEGTSSMDRRDLQDKPQNAQWNPV